MSATGSPAAAFSTDAVSAVSLSASGAHLAAACTSGAGALVVTPVPAVSALRAPCTSLLADASTLQAAAPALSAVAFESDARVYTADSRGALTLYTLSASALERTHQVQAAHSGAALTGVAAAPGLTATSGKDGLIKAWDAATGVCVARLKGHKGEARAVCIASTEDHDAPLHLLASAGRDKTVRLWDVRAGGGRAVHVFAGHAGWVHAVTMCAGPNPRILSCGGDKTVRVWSLANMQEEAVLSGHEYRVWAVAAAPFGQFAVSGSTDTNVRFWPLDGTPHAAQGAVWEGHGDSVLAVAVARDASFAVSAAENGSVLLWDVEKMRAAGEADVAPAPMAAYAGAQDTASVAVEASVAAEASVAVEASVGGSPPLKAPAVAEPSSAPASPRKEFEKAETPQSPRKVEGPKRRVVYSPSVSEGRIRFLEEQVALRDRDVAERDVTISERDLKIAELQSKLKEREKEIRLLQSQLESAQNLAKEANVRALGFEGSDRDITEVLNYAEPIDRISRVTGQLKALASRLDDMIVS